MMVSFYGYDDGRRDLLLLNETKQKTRTVVSMLSWGDLTFGFEFEFIGNATPEARERFKAFMKENNIPYVFTGVYGKNSEDAWTLGADGSVGDMTTCKYIEKAKRNFGYELVSPVLHVSDFPVIDKVLAAVKYILKGTLNRTCGTHVHIGNIGGMTEHDFMHKGNKATSFMNAVVWLYMKLQPYLWDNLIPKWRVDQPFCKTYVNGAYERDKYLALSGKGKHGTLESRVHHGTLEYDEITDWAIMLAHFLAYCYNNHLHIKLNPNLEKFDCMMSLLEQFGYEHDEAETLLKKRLARVDHLNRCLYRDKQ